MNKIRYKSVESVKGGEAPQKHVSSTKMENEETASMC